MAGTLRRCPFHPLWELQLWARGWGATCSTFCTVTFISRFCLQYACSRLL